MQVKHTNFGIGTVTAHTDGIIVVNFETVGEKSIMAQFSAKILFNLDGTPYVPAENFGELKKVERTVYVSKTKKVSKLRETMGAIANRNEMNGKTWNPITSTWN